MKSEMIRGTRESTSRVLESYGGEASCLDSSGRVLRQRAVPLILPALSMSAGQQMSRSPIHPDPENSPTYLLSLHGDAGPVIRPKWRRRQSILIKQITTRAVAPSIADCYWHRHLRTRYYDRDSIDRCFRPAELSVRTGDGEANQLAATESFYATTAICKSNPDFVSFDCHRLVKRSGIDNRLLVGCA